MKYLRDVVDADDEVVGTATKEEIEADGLNCRVAFILLTTSGGRLVLQQRAATKRAYPLFWSGAAAGHLIAGESYDEAARRELREELGIATELAFIGKFYSREDREWVGVFVGTHNGPYTAEPLEVEAVRTYEIDELTENTDSLKLTSFVERALPLLRQYLRR